VERNYMNQKFPFYMIAIGLTLIVMPNTLIMIADGFDWIRVIVMIALMIFASTTAYLIWIKAKKTNRQLTSFRE